MTNVPGRAASGVRIAGDDYQALITWNEVLLAMDDHNRAVTITVEDVEAASVDDVVIEYDDGSHRYVQVKHAVDATSPVGDGWLCTPAKSGSRSLLQKFHASWIGLRDRGPIEMELITDRNIDHGDVLMKCWDSTSEKLTPLIAGQLTRAGRQQLEEWAAHVNADVPTLIEMLATLRIRAGRPEAAELERAKLLMRLQGFDYSQAAIDGALALMRSWIRDRWRTLTVAELRVRATERIPRLTDPWNHLVIEAIDSLKVDTADESLRFIHLYPDVDPFQRRQLVDPSNWPMVATEITNVANRMRDAGATRVLITAAMRLPMWFATGAAFRSVRGFHVAAQQVDQLWRSDLPVGDANITTEVTAVDGATGDDLAVVVAASAPAARSAMEFVTENQPMVSHVVVLGPEAKPSTTSIRDAQHALAVATSMRDEVRVQLRSSKHIHLFMAAPQGLALLLGHLWNSLAPTSVYEHLGGSEYTPAFEVSA